MTPDRARPSAPGGTSEASRYPDAMSKRTSRQKANARRKKANHGRKPNMGRNS